MSNFVDKIRQVTCYTNRVRKGKQVLVHIHEGFSLWRPHANKTKAPLCISWLSRADK